MDDAGAATKTDAQIDSTALDSRAAALKVAV